MTRRSGHGPRFHDQNRVALDVGYQLPAVAAMSPTPLAGRPWHAVWPERLPPSFDYPPERPPRCSSRGNVPRFAGRVAVRELDFQTLAERRVLSYEALIRAAQVPSRSAQAIE